MIPKVYTHTRLPSSSEIPDGTIYIAVDAIRPGAVDPRVSLLNIDFSHYVHVYPDEYATDINKVRIGDIVRCYHDDNHKVMGLNVNCGDSFHSRANLFRYFNACCDELEDIWDTKNGQAKYNYAHSLLILGESIKRNSRCFGISRPDVFSYDKYCRQLNRLDYLAGKVANAINSGYMLKHLRELQQNVEHIDTIYSNAQKYGDWVDKMPDRDSSPRSQQTSLDQFVSAPSSKR